MSGLTASTKFYQGQTKEEKRRLGYLRAKNRRLMTLLHARGLDEKKVSIMWFGGNRSIVTSS